ncbi:MAG: IPT/TIG domain-containing protein [Polyangiaceae bacterium]
MTRPRAFRSGPSFPFVVAVAALVAGTGCLGTDGLDSGSAADSDAPIERDSTPGNGGADGGPKSGTGTGPMAPLGERTPRSYAVDPLTVRLDGVANAAGATVITPGVPTRLTLTGIGWSPNAIARVDGAPHTIVRAPTNGTTQTTSGTVEVTVPESRAGRAIPVVVQDDPMQVESTTGIVWLTVPTKTNGLAITRINPDYGVPGETVSIAGSGFAAGTTVRDAGGSVVAPKILSDGAMTFVIPAGFATGTLRVERGGETFEGPVFRTKANLLHRATSKAVSTLMNFPTTLTFDGRLDTSWHGTNAACATGCVATGPSIAAAPQKPMDVRVIAVRGDRVTTNAAPFVGRLKLYDASNALLDERTVVLEGPLRDADVDLGRVVHGVAQVAFAITAAKRDIPGLAEIEAFGD